MATHKDTTYDGYVIEIQTLPESSRWDYSIEVSHPRLAIKWENSICGGQPLVDETRAVLLTEARALGAHFNLTPASATPC